MTTPLPPVTTYHRPDCAVFWKTKDLYGGLSNMAAGYPLEINGVRVPTSEALFQSLRFPARPDVQRLIVEQSSPMGAKMKGRPYRKAFERPDWWEINVAVMQWCLRVKLAQHWERFGALLLATGERPIVEQSRRDDFWGARPGPNDTLIGRNVLGRLLIELRAELRGAAANNRRRVAPPPVPDLLFLGQAVQPIAPPAREHAEPPPDTARTSDTPTVQPPRVDDGPPTGA